MYKHYIVLNEKDEVIDKFSSYQRESIETDILFMENRIRQFHLDITDVETGFIINKYDHDTKKISIIPKDERGTPAQRNKIKRDKWKWKREKGYNIGSDNLFIETMSDILRADGVIDKTTMKAALDAQDIVKANIPAPILEDE